MEVASSEFAWLKNPLRGFLCIAGFLTLSIAGCGKNPPPAATNGDTDSAAVTSAASSSTDESSPSAASATKSGGSSKQRGRDEVWVDDQGQKWFGNVPYDVFFDQPLTVASNQTPLNGMAVAASNNGPISAEATPLSTGQTPPDATGEPMPAGTADSAAVAPGSTTTTAGSAGGGGWADLISATELDEEVKSIRNFMNENLQSVGNYNSSMLMIPPKAAALAVLAEVAIQHPDSVSWKDDAIYVRNLAKQMNSSPLQRGPKDQKRLLGLFESVSDTLNRSRPAGLEEPPESDSFADVAEMRLVMMRMEEAEKRMRTEAGSEGSFTSNKSMVQQEAALLATMTHTITLTGYGYEDDPEFVGFGGAIVEAAKSILNAAEAGDFATYEVAMSKISTTCQSCHSQFKND